MTAVIKKRFGFTGAAAVWTAFIFSQSLLSGAVSSAESGTVLRFLQSLFGSTGFGGWVTEHLIRKTAHFTEYAILGVLLILAVYSFGRLRRSPTVPLFLGLLVPVLDESLQLFTEGRAGQLSDVLLDYAGALTGMALCLLVLILLRRRKRAKNNG